MEATSVDTTINRARDVGGFSQSGSSGVAKKMPDSGYV